MMPDQDPCEHRPMRIGSKPAPKIAGSLARIFHKLANIQRNTPRHRKFRPSHPKHRAFKPEVQGSEIPIIYLTCISGLNNVRAIEQITNPSFRVDAHRRIDRHYNFLGRHAVSYGIGGQTV